MEYKRYQDRTNVSLILSTLLHGSVIAVIALGPTFIPGLMNGTKPVGEGNNMIEVSVAQSEDLSNPTEQNIAPAPVVAVEPEPLPAPAPVPVQKAPPTPTPAKEETPVVVAPAPVKEVKKAEVKPKAKPKTVAKAKAEALPEKETLPENVEAAPALAVDENSGAADLEPKDEMVEEQEQIAKEEVAQTPVEEMTPEPTEMDKLAKEERVQPAPQPVATNYAEQKPDALATKTMNQNEMANKNADAGAPNGTPAPIEQSGGSAGAQKTIEVTQNYLQLKQLPGNKAPSYSEEMRLKKLQGSGQIVYYVTKSGQVGELHLTKSTGSPQLDQAAVSAFKKYKFVPGQEGYTIHEFEFVLTGPSESSRARLRTSN